MKDKSKTSDLTKKRSQRSLFTLIFSAVICLGVLIPMPSSSSSVPFTVQNMLAILSGLILGGLQGAGSTGIFLILGVLGLPVFTGMKAGFAVLSGETGGYLWGYFISSLAAGLIAGTPHQWEKKFNWKTWLRLFLAALLSFALIYVPGILWFRHTALTNPENAYFSVLSKLDAAAQWKKIFQLALLPFLPGDIIKLIVCVPVSAVLRPVLAKVLYPSDEEEEKQLFELMSRKKVKMDALKASVSSGKKKKHSKKSGK